MNSMDLLTNGQVFIESLWLLSIKGQIQQNKIVHGIVSVCRHKQSN